MVSILHLSLVIVCVSYFLGLTWFVIIKIHSYNQEQSEEKYFHWVYKLNKDSDIEVLVKNMYFAFTTLSTVGFGDLHPKNSIERVLTTLIMLGGTMFFSYTMNLLVD